MTDFIDITSLVKPRPVLNFNFSTIMLFRCTRKGFAKSFRKGKIYFNQPKKWIQDEENGNKGRGDILEGTFMTIKSDDKSQFVNKLKKDENLKNFEYQGFTYFRRREIENLYCLCFYGLNDNSFTEKSIDKDGKAHYISRVENEYFTDFSDNITKEKYDEIKEDEKPVVIFISNPHKLFEKIKQFFIKLGIEEKEIIVSPVEYLNKKEIAISAVPFPKELLLKDEYYFKQSELRIIINSTSPKLLEFMEKNNNTIDIGNIEDITEIYDYYFNDLLIEKDGKNSILFNLPTPQLEAFTDMDLQRLLQILLQVTTDNLPQPLKSEEEKNDLICYLKQTIKNKYKIDVQCNGNKINIYNADDSIFKYFDELSKPYEKMNDFEKNIKILIQNNKYEDALNEIQKISEDSELSKIGYYYEGKILEYKKQYSEAIDKYTYCIDQEIKLADALSSRSNCFSRSGKYDLAIKDLETLQEKIGYNPQIYSNKGINLLHLGDLNNSINEFNKSIDMNEKNPEAYYNRSVAYYRQKNWTEAKKDIEKALTYNPKNELYRKEYERFYKNV